MNQIHTNATNLSALHRVDFNLYPMFLAVYEHQSMSKAATNLSLSQSAVSHGIQRLRMQLNDQLFVRSGSKIFATPFAEQIYPVILQSLKQIEMVSMRNHNFDTNSIKELRIAIHDEIEPIILPKLFSHFQKLNLSIHFQSFKLNRKTLLTDLSTQQIDFVIDLEQVHHENIGFNKIIEDDFVVCTQNPYMDQAIYFSSPHIGVSSRRSGILIEDIFLKSQNLQRDIFLRCQQYSTALQILDQYETAILTVPRSILNYLNPTESCFIHELPVELSPLSIGLYWYKVLENNQRIYYLLKEINKIFA